MPSTPAPLPGTATIRLGIALLGAIGFALSYDALRQMALAIHIRGPLTYAFPLVIDGFIAIGICALIILRTAPLRSRLYVWALVGTATVTSIWANALHAIHLNHRTQLHLDDVTVGALSAIAPLALAGAVHLYLVIRRHLATHRPQEGSATHRHTALVGQPGRADTPFNTPTPMASSAIGRSHRKARPMRWRKTAPIMWRKTPPLWRRPRSRAPRLRADSPAPRWTNFSTSAAPRPWDAMAASRAATSKRPSEPRACPSARTDSTRSRTPCKPISIVRPLAPPDCPRRRSD